MPFSFTPDERQPGQSSPSTRAASTSESVSSSMSSARSVDPTRMNRDELIQLVKHLVGKVKEKNERLRQMEELIDSLVQAPSPQETTARVSSTPVSGTAALKAELDDRLFQCATQISILEDSLRQSELVGKKKEEQIEELKRSVEHWKRLAERVKRRKEVGSSLFSSHSASESSTSSLPRIPHTASHRTGAGSEAPPLSSALAPGEDLLNALFDPIPDTVVTLPCASTCEIEVQTEPLEELLALQLTNQQLTFELEQLRLHPAMAAPAAAEESCSPSVPFSSASGAAGASAVNNPTAAPSTSPHPPVEAVGEDVKEEEPRWPSSRSLSRASCDAFEKTSREWSSWAKEAVDESRFISFAAELGSQFDELYNECTRLYTQNAWLTQQLSNSEGFKAAIMKELELR